jgi:hypothetical protein
MTTRNGRDQWLRELKAALMTRVARRALSTSKRGLDGIAKSLLERQASGALEPDPELDHPEDWDRPID